MARKVKAFNAYPFQYHEELIVEIESLSNLGDGVVKVPVAPRENEETQSERSWVIFVPLALPQERVRIQIWRNDKNCSHANLMEIIEPSPHRVEPRCQYFGACGGCQYQHLSYEAQLDWKRKQVADLLDHIARVTHKVNAPIASPKAWNYRSKITPHIQKSKNGKVREIGFLRKGTRNALVDVDRCAIAMNQINEVLPHVRQSSQRRSGATKNGTSLLLRANEERVYDNPREIMSEQVGETTFSFLAGDFFQNNPFILPAFVDYASKQAMAGSDFLIDAYCGSGLFGLSLAKHFQEVSMVEVSETGADWARYNAKANSIENAKIHTASAEHIFSQMSYPAKETTVLIDPPRKGCNDGFLSQLFDFGPARVVYISCDPATQARDLKLFVEANYEIIDVQPVDLFPQTRHLECIVTLTEA